MSKSQLFDEEKVARIFMDLPDEGDTSDDPDFSGNEGEFNEVEGSSNAVDACDGTTTVQGSLRDAEGWIQETFDDDEEPFRLTSTIPDSNPDPISGHSRVLPVSPGPSTVTIRDSDDASPPRRRRRLTRAATAALGVSSVMLYAPPPSSTLPVSASPSLPDIATLSYSDVARGLIYVKEEISNDVAPGQPAARQQRRRVVGPPPPKHHAPTWGRRDGPLNVQYPKFLGVAHGPTEPLDCSSSLAFFEQMWPGVFVDHIANETNKYFHQSSKTSWSNDTTSEEIKAFLGVLLLMGIHVVPEIEDYFSSDELLSVSAVTKVFTRNRFWQLWGNLHLADNHAALPKGHPKYDKLYKLRPLLSTMQSTFRKYFQPGQNCAVDEHMVKGKGRNPFKQCMPNKPIKRGTKIWELGCSCCGYIYSFQIYTGAEGNPEHGLSHRVVMDLAGSLTPKQNHVIYMDNFFSSFQLLKDLKSTGNYGVGTIRSLSTGFPAKFKNKAFITNMQKNRGEFHSYAEDTPENSVLCTMWSDTKCVAFVTNVHSAGGNDAVERKKADGTIMKVPAPSMVKDYNRNMGAIDLHDQLQQSYATDRKSSRWWLRIFLDFLNAATVNAYILYKLSFQLVNNPMPKKKLQPLSHKQFRLDVIRGLIGTFTCRKLPGPQLANQIQPALLFRMDHTNVNLVAENIMCGGRCYYCCCGRGANARRVETRRGCVTCKKRLCAGACHDSYHRQLFGIDSHDD